MTTNSPAAQPQGGELLPCPRGHEAQVCNSNGEMFYVVCLDQNCFWTLGEAYDRDAIPDHSFRSEEEAAEAWNTRADLPRATADAQDGQRFYELMQAYRRATIGDRNAVAEAFEAVKSFVNATPRAAIETTVEAALPDGYWPKLMDRGDGVKGHYCIGRLIRPNEIYWEFWNHGQWVSAGEVFIGKDAALEAMAQVRATHTAGSVKDDEETT